MMSAQQVEWSNFSDAMFSGDKKAARSIMRRMTDAENRIAARRWIDGPTASEKAKSASRQRAIAKPSAEVRRDMAAMWADPGFIGNSPF